MEPILNLWLKEVPPYTVVFAQCIVASQIIGNFSVSLYTPMTAANKIKKNSVAAVIFGFGYFIILYLILKFGGDVMWIQYMNLINMALWSYIIKPYILYKDVDYNIKEMANCIFATLKVGLVSILLSIPVRLMFDDSILGCLIVLLSTIVAVSFSSYIFMYKEDRNKIVIYIKNKLSQFKNNRLCKHSI